MKFTYTAVSSSGEKKKGLIEANTEREVAEYLLNGGISPLTIKQTQVEGIGLFSRKITNSDIVIFTRQLHSLVSTGITLIESLNILKEQTKNPRMKTVIIDLITSIQEGKSLSQALSSHKGVFKEVYIALIRAGETGGLLDKVLGRLADNLEKADATKRRVKGALFYPAIVMAGVIVVITIMNIFVIPQLGKLYESLNLDLPLTTRVVLRISKLFTKSWPILLIAAPGLYVFYKRFKKTEVGQKTLDKIKLNIPVIGSIISLSTLDEITRTLSLLIGAGVSIIEALNITADISDNIWFREAVRNSAELVEKGINLSSAFSNHKIFPLIIIQMVRVGESTGRVDDGLLKVAEYFERDLDIKVKTLTTAIEPILIIILGVTVAFLVLSVITPIYSLISQLQ